MSSSKAASAGVRVAVENIGGIDEATVELEPGVTALTGRNATNRTSFLQAVMAALGSERSSLKGDADEGHVELAVGDEVYTRSLMRRNGTIVTGGDPYLDDPELADLFAFLLESNEARRAISRAEDLRELIMRPVDTDAIQAEIDRLEAEKREIDATLEELDTVETRLPGLESERTQLREEIEEKKAERDELEAAIESADEIVEESREEKAALQEQLDELGTLRSTLDDVRFELETERESLNALREEQSSLEAEFEELPETPMGDHAEIEKKVAELRERRQELDTGISELQSLIQFNEGMLEGASNIAARIADESGDRNGESVTDRLVSDSEGVVCWTCGSDVAKEQIKSTVDRLQEVHQERMEARSEVRAKLETLTQKQRNRREQQQRREQLERRMRRVESEIEEREENVESLEARREEHTEAIAEQEAAVEEQEREEYSEILDLHREANQLEFELGRLQNRLEDVESQISELEARLAEAPDLEDQRADVQAELEDRRTRIEQIEAEAVAQFNEHMETILTQLEYQNLERIWIERVERSVRRGRRTVTESVFDLHVIRSSESGSTYEDTIDHLSESEREVTGLIFALAGYLVHDLHEQLPFMLLDSLEAVDSNRIATLIDYFEEYADYLIVALLPEDAAGLADRHRRVTEI